MEVVRLPTRGAPRVLNGVEGMSFEVDHHALTGDGQDFVCHVRVYRYPGDHWPFQIWSLRSDDCQNMAP